jgi:hypothetical protein
MNPLGWLDQDGHLETSVISFSSQGMSYSMPYYGGAVMTYNVISVPAITPVVPVLPIGSGCLLALLGIR